MSELKPCPCCNGEAKRTEDIFLLPTSKIVYCGVCGLRTKPCATWEETETDWNRRAQPTNEPLTLDELREMDGEPVFLVIEDVNGFEPLTMWALVEVNDDGIWLTNNLGGRNCYEDVLGDGITAHRRKPEGSENDAKV